MLHKKLDIRVVLMMVFVSSVLNGCSSTTDKPASEIAQTVKNREIAFAKTMTDRDVKAFQRFISPEAIFFNGNTPVVGNAVIVEAWKPWFEEEEAPFSWRPDVIEVLESGHLALTSGPVTGPSGEDFGRFNSIWRLDEDGQWRVVFDKGC